VIIIFGSILPFSNEKVARYYVYSIDAIRSTVKSITQRAYSKKQISNITYQVNNHKQHSGGDQLETYAPPVVSIGRKTILLSNSEEAIIQRYATLNYTGNRANDTLLIPFIFQNVKEEINNTYSFRILSPSNVDADYFSGIQLQITHSNNNIDQIYFDVSVVSEGDVTVDKIYLWIYN
jgi:hypothetical protein